MPLIASLLASLPLAVPAPAPDLAALAAGLGYRVRVVDDRPATCPPPAADPASAPVPAGVASPPPPRCMIADIDIDTPAGVAVPAGLEIRTSLIGSVMAIDSDDFTSRTVNGDVTVFALKPGRTLAPGRHYRLRLTTTVPFFSRSFVMPMAATSRGFAPTRPSASAAQESRLVRISVWSCSTHPCWG